MANRAALRKREEEEQEFERRQRELLARVDAARKLENAVTRAEAQADIGARLYHYFTHMGFEALNTPDTLPRVLKTRNTQRLIEVYMSHMFERYPVPQHLRSIFAQMKLDTLLENDQTRPIPNQWADAVLAYFVAGRGGSLFKEVYKGIIAKKECHYFLTAPKIEHYNEALVFAIARSFTDNIGLAKRIARCRHLTTPQWAYNKVGAPLHRETIRFFVNHPTPLSEMTDLCDYIFREAVYTEDRHFNPQWSFNGRSLAALRRSTRDWHYALARAKKIGGGNWPGLPFEDTIRFNEPAPSGKRVDWAIIQIKTGNDLAEEGTKMRHCVASYKHQCIGGRTGIFSLRLRTHRPEGHSEHFEPPRKWERACTIEVSKGYSSEEFAVVQVKRLANYAALPAEQAAVSDWARMHGLRITGGAFAGIRAR